MKQTILCMFISKRLHYVNPSLKEQKAMQLLCMCCGLMQFLSESLPLYLLGVVVLETLYSPLYNWSLTISSDPCQSSVSDEHIYMVGGEKHNTIMTLNNSWFVPCVNWQSSVHLCCPCNSASVVTLRALRTWSVAFEAILWQNLNQLYDKWRSLKWLFTVVTWSPTLNVMSFLATPPSSLVVPSPAFGAYQCNKRDMWNLCEQNFMIISTPLRSVSNGPTFYPSE